MKEVKLEWCKNFVNKTFKKLPEGITGIETNLFFEKAEKAGLYVKDTYGTPISKALSELTIVDTITYNGEFCYNVFRLKK